MKDIVFHICEQMLAHSPEASYKRLNPALRSTLANCIEADLPFQPDTFRRIYNQLRGHWWFGDGAGSHAGEHFYTLACQCNHASAQQSFERFAGRPGVLWEEAAKSPVRLHVGAEFTWRGHHVTVTSLRKESLVACTYHGYPNRVEGLKVGAVIGYDKPHIITSVKRDGKASVLTVLRVLPAPKNHGERAVARRFTITYAEIVEVRRESKARLKVILQRIAECNPETDAVQLTKDVNAAHFRHWELEDIRSAFTARKTWVEEHQSNAERIEAWRKGKNGAWLGVKATLLRVRGDLVECSNGNSVSKVAARAVLPILLDRRKSSSALNLPIDGYRVDRVSPAGVVVGCTTVPWEEIDRIAPELAGK